jgi:hypothetical protein
MGRDGNGVDAALVDDACARCTLVLRHRGTRGVMQRPIEAVLAEWREVERRLAETEHGTPDSEWLQAEASRLRREYHRLFEAIEVSDMSRDARETTSGA